MNTTQLVKSSQIDGVLLHQVRLVSLDEHKDSRGSFTEIFQDHWGTVLSRYSGVPLNQKPMCFEECTSMFATTNIFA